MKDLQDELSSWAIWKESSVSTATGKKSIVAIDPRTWEGKIRTEKSLMSEMTN